MLENVENICLDLSKNGYYHQNVKKIIYRVARGKTSDDTKERKTCCYSVHPMNFGENKEGSKDVQCANCLLFL